MRPVGSWQQSFGLQDGRHLLRVLPLVLAVSLTAIPLNFDYSAAYCQDAQSTDVSASSVVQCLEQNKYVTLVGKAQAVVDGPRLLIALYQDPRANVRDLKINSVLLAKGLSDRFGDRFEHYVFSHYPLAEQSTYCQATLSRADLTAFGAGHLPSDQLLSRVKVEPFLAASLKRRYQSLSYLQIIADDQVVESYGDNHKQDRKEIKARILSLKRSGYDVSVAEKRFLKMEDFVRRHENFDHAEYAAAWRDIELCLQDSVNAGTNGNGSTLRKIKIASDERSSWQR